MRNKQFKIGDRHTKNLILDKKYENNKTMYFVRCDCGDERWVRTDILRKNKNGCSKCFSSGIRKEGEGHSINSAWKSLRTNAKSRNIKVEITKEDFIEMAKSNCFYCDAEPLEKIYYNQPKWSTPAKLNGIDRVDNNKDYTIENSVPCCYTCNRGKMNLSLEEFKAWIIKLSQREWIHE